MTDEAFSRAARTYGDTLFRVAYHALQNRADAEDVMQTVLLRLYESRKEFESEAHLKHWLLRVAVNESRKVLRSFWRRRAVSLDEQRDEAAPEDSAQREVFEAVMALEPKYRLTIYLYYYEGYSAGEIAQLLGEKPATVSTQLSRGRQQLRTLLESEGLT